MGILTALMIINNSYMISKENQFYKDFFLDSFLRKSFLNSELSQDFLQNFNTDPNVNIESLERDLRVERNRTEQVFFHLTQYF